MNKYPFDRSEALSVHNLLPVLLVLLLGDPHVLEGGEGREDGPSDPDQELPLWRGDDLDGVVDGDGHVLVLEDLVVESGLDVGEHGGSSRHHDVGVELPPDVEVALQDGVHGDSRERGHLLAQHQRVEERLGASPSLGGDGDHSSVGEFVLLVVGLRVLVH